MIRCTGTHKINEALYRGSQNIEYVGLNIFYSGIKYTEKDWVQLKVLHYPRQRIGYVVQGLTKYRMHCSGIDKIPDALYRD